jgi:hypothetical protein
MTANQACLNEQAKMIKANKLILNLFKEAC